MYLDEKSYWYFVGVKNSGINENLTMQENTTKGVKNIEVNFEKLLLFMHVFILEKIKC
jgi:hypothetical protein